MGGGRGGGEEAHDSKKPQEEVKTRTVEKRNTSGHIRITFQVYDVFRSLSHRRNERLVSFISIFPFLSNAFRFFALLPPPLVASLVKILFILEIRSDGTHRAERESFASTTRLPRIPIQRL